jgi:hypothetical protein
VTTQEENLHVLEKPKRRGKNGAEMCVARRKDSNCLVVISSALLLRFLTPLAELPDPIWGKRFWRALERQQIQIMWRNQMNFLSHLEQIVEI